MAVPAALRLAAPAEGVPGLEVERGAAVATAAVGEIGQVGGEEVGSRQMRGETSPAALVALGGQQDGGNSLQVVVTAAAGLEGLAGRLTAGAWFEEGTTTGATPAGEAVTFSDALMPLSALHPPLSPVLLTASSSALPVFPPSELSSPFPALTASRPADHFCPRCWLSGHTSR